MTRLALILLLGLSAGIARADVAPDSLLEHAEEDAALREAEHLGKRLFRHDQAAAVATDALMKVRGFRRNRNLEGWVTEARDDRTAVTFFGKGEDGSQVALYRVVVDLSGSVLGRPAALRSPEPLSEFEAAASRARALALASSFQPCAEKYNSVVLPGDTSPDSWQVYLLPGTEDHRVIPIGGSYRVEVDLSTGASEMRPYTKSCIQLQNDPRAVGLMITHLLDPAPTEVHVFWSMWAQKSMYVATPPNGTIWSVQGPKIKLVERGQEQTTGERDGDVGGDGT